VSYVEKQRKMKSRRVRKTKAEGQRVILGEGRRHLSGVAAKRWQLEDVRGRREGSWSLNFEGSGRERKIRRLSVVHVAARGKIKGKCNPSLRKR
jgi:hypothetical protein